MSEPRPEFKKKELALSASPYVYLPADIPVYTVEVCHREEINGDLLQQALDRTVQRMPYLTDTLVVEETGKVWYAENPLPMLAAHTAELRRVGGRETNYHMLDLTWDENKTWFSMFHGFCDGQGISAFLETVLYYYYCLKDGKTYDPNGIRTDASPMDEGEFQEPLSHPYAIDPDFAMPEKKEQPAPYHLPEFSPTRDTSFRVYSLRVSSGEMMDFVRKNGTSPSVMFSMLMGEAILRVHPEADAPVMANVPVSVRKILGCEETFKNCSSRIILPLHGTPMDAMPFAERAAALRGLLKMQMNPNIFRMRYNYLGNLYRQRMENAVSYAEEIKKPAGFMNISHDTFYTDYIGSFHQTGYSDQITDVHFLCKPPMGSVPHMNIIEHDGQFRMEILACCDFTAYAEAMAEAMKGFGLSVTTMPEWSFLTPLTNWREGMQITASRNLTERDGIGENSMKANETTSGIGMIEGSTYRNKFFSVEYTLPEGYSFYNADQLTAMNSAIIKLHNDQAVLDAFKKGNAFFDMTAVAENNPNVSVVIQIAGSDATIVNEAGYIEAARGKIIDQLNSTGAAVKSDETGTYTNLKTGDKFTAMKLAIETQGAPLYEEILCIKAGDHFMNVTVTASDEVELDSVLSHLTRIR